MDAKKKEQLPKVSNYPIWQHWHVSAQHVVERRSKLLSIDSILLSDIVAMPWVKNMIKMKIDDIIKVPETQNCIAPSKIVLDLSAPCFVWGHNSFVV